MYFAEKPAMIWTILGPCLGIVFYSKQHRTGAIAHAQLPEQDAIGLCCDTSCQTDCFPLSVHSGAFKYVSCTFRYLLNRFHSLGIRENEIDVKLFGGSTILENNRSLKTVGQKNVETAFRMIKECNLNLVNKNIGGSRGRKIYFFSDTGEVYTRQVRPFSINP